MGKLSLNLKLYTETTARGSLGRFSDHADSLHLFDLFIQIYIMPFGVYMTCVSPKLVVKVLINRKLGGSD